MTFKSMILSGGIFVAAKRGETLHRHSLDIARDTMHTTIDHVSRAKIVLDLIHKYIENEIHIEASAFPSVDSERDAVKRHSAPRGDVEGKIARHFKTEADAV